MWWMSLLKKIAMAKLAQKGIGGQIGSSYLEDAWFPQKQEQRSIGFGSRMNPISGEIQGGFQQGQPKTFWDMFFEALMRGR